MAIDGIMVWRGMSCLVRRALGQRAMDHGRQEYHMMWEDKRKTGTSMVWYTGSSSSRGGKALIPALPRFLHRATLLLADPTGGFVQRIPWSTYHNWKSVHGQSVWSDKQGSSSSSSSKVTICRPMEAIERQNKGRLRPTQDWPPLARDSTSRDAVCGHKQGRVLSSARRVDQSGVRPQAGQADGQSVTIYRS